MKNHKSSNLEIQLSARKAALFLVVCVAVLSVLHLLSKYLAYNMSMSRFALDLLLKFDMGAENSIPTWFSVLLLFSAGMLTLLVAGSKLRSKDKFRLHWLFLGLMLIYMSADEAAELHEIGSRLKLTERLGIESSYFSFSWVAPAIVLVLIIVTLFFRFWLSLPNKIKLLFALSAVIFVSGAIGVEMFSADYSHTYGRSNFMYRGVLALIEEGMEKLGITLLVFSLLEYIKDQKISTTLRVAK